MNMLFLEGILSCAIVQILLKSLDYESHPELLEKNENQELLEAAKYRKLFYECDRAVLG